MQDEVIKINVADWVEAARSDPIAYAQRQATEVLLVAISMAEILSETLYLKGGILMGLAYNSPRQTNDVDLTTTMAVTQDSVETIETTLNTTMPLAAVKLGYTDLVFRVQSIKKQPRKKGFEKLSFPALKIKIGYAKRGSGQAEKLKTQQGSSTVIDADISFNEPMQSIQLLQLTEENGIRAYAISDLVAEKYRAMLQQAIRDRYRRQDVYDLSHLIKSKKIETEHLPLILSSFLKKSNARDIHPNKASLDDPEIRKRSEEDWGTLEQEIGELPDFADSFEIVTAFYRSLPWPN